MNWEVYLGHLPPTDLPLARQLAQEYGQPLLADHVLHNPVRSLAELEEALKKRRSRVLGEIPGLYESIDLNRQPPGWSVTNILQTEADGTVVAQTDVVGPNGASGFFERGYNATERRLELRNAFLQHNGTTTRLPAWAAGGAVQLDPARGTPTVQYFTLYQLRLLRVPAGRRRWWRWLHRLRLRTGPFAESGVLSCIKMSTIQNLETIVHLHWLRQRFPGSGLNELIAHTASVQYGDTTAGLCGYRVTAVRYVPGDEREKPVGDLMAHFESGNPQRRAENDDILARYSLDRADVMKQNFDIELAVEPC